MFSPKFSLDEFNPVREIERGIGECIFELDNILHVPLEVVLVVHASVELCQPFLIGQVQLFSQPIPLVVPMEELNVVFAFGHKTFPFNSEGRVSCDLRVVLLKEINNLVIGPFVSHNKGLHGLLPF